MRLRRRRRAVEFGGHLCDWQAVLDETCPSRYVVRVPEEEYVALVTATDARRVNRGREGGRLDRIQDKVVKGTYVCGRSENQ